MAGMTIPLGCKFKFEPEDHEILIYLSCKCKGELLPCEGFIKEVDLYSLSDPGILFERTQEKVVYVFTKLKKMVKNGKRVNRTVSGNRTWKGLDGGKPIYDGQGCLVGGKKNFVLVNKMKMKLGYSMKEFSLDNDSLRNSRFNEYVVCQIKKKAKKARSLQDGNFPEEEGICPTFVSTPATEGDVMAYSEEGYQHDEGNSIVPSQSQKEEAEQCYPISEHKKGTSDRMSMLGGDCGSDMGLRSSEYFDPKLYEEVNSWMLDDFLEEQYENISEASVVDMIHELTSAMDNDYSAIGKDIRPTSVSAPAIEGDVMAYSEVGYQVDSGMTHGVEEQDKRSKEISVLDMNELVSAAPALPLPTGTITINAT